MSGQWSDQWTNTLVTTAGWADLWNGAPFYNPDGTVSDTGNRQDIIGDDAITTAVNALVAAQKAAADAAAQAADTSGAAS